MLNLLFIPVGILYLLVVVSLFFYGLNLFYLTWLTWRNRGRNPDPPELDSWPPVTVQLPIYNEMYVAARLVQSAAQLDYPRHLLEIQVLDDSSDETCTIVADLVERLKAQGLNIVHLRRPTRQDFKSGALAHGLAQANGEHLAIFDADFLPPPDFLKKTIPYFQDASVGFVQTRWGHVNRDYSFLTFLQALAIDAHFMIEQQARSQVGYWFNFNGTAGIWRRAAIQAAGGWQGDTLTEDLDLSYRTYLAGWRGLYLRDVVVRAELPVSISAYRRQQHRWARGSLECARKYIPKVWRAPIPLFHKAESTLHLLGYGVHLLLCALVILHPLVMLLSMRYFNLVSLFGFTVLFNTTTFAQAIFILSAQHQLGNRWWQILPLIVIISASGTGMMLNTARAALELLTRRKGVFERTPKFGITQRKQDWTHHRYQLDLDPIVYYEIAFALLNAVTCGIALHTHNWVIAIYAALFFAGLALMSGLTISQAIVVRQRNFEWQKRKGLAGSNPE